MLEGNATEITPGYLGTQHEGAMLTVLVTLHQARTNQGRKLGSDGRPWHLKFEVHVAKAQEGKKCVEHRHRALSHNLCSPPPAPTIGLN